jgi:hypothetical protein
MLVCICIQPTFDVTKEYALNYDYNAHHVTVSFFMSCIIFQFYKQRERESEEISAWIELRLELYNHRNHPVLIQFPTLYQTAIMPTHLK